MRLNAIMRKFNIVPIRLDQLEHLGFDRQGNPIHNILYNAYRHYQLLPVENN